MNPFVIMESDFLLVVHHLKYLFYKHLATCTSKALGIESEIEDLYGTLFRFYALNPCMEDHRPPEE